MFGYKIWDSGNCLHEADDFETEDEAREDAKEQINSIIEDWKLEGCYDGETEEDFEIDIEEYDDHYDDFDLDY